MEKNLQDLQLQIQTLKKEKDEIESKYNCLQKDYSENTIIQSMNDMKERYEQLMLNTVSRYRYENLLKKYNCYSKKICTINILLHHTMKRLKILEQNALDGNEMDLYRIEFELLTIKEILEDEEII